MIGADFQLLFNVMDVLNGSPGYDLSSIFEHLCRCALEDDEAGLAEWSSTLSWLIGKAPDVLN